MAEALASGPAASPLPETPRDASRVSQQQKSLIDDEDDSGSEYSECQSPAISRPTSMRASNDPRPISVCETREEEAEEGAQDSGSEYSEPPTPKTSRPSSIHLTATGAEVPTEEQQTPNATRQSQGSLVSQHQSRPASGKNELVVDTSSPQIEGTVDSNMPIQEEERPMISTSPQPVSPIGSHYSGSPPQSPSSPAMTNVPLSPMAPHEAHMSISSMQSIALLESSLDYDHLSPDQVEDALATPRMSGARHTRKPSSLEILQNSWGPPARQSTLFDMSKDQPPETPLSESDHDGGDSFFETPSEWRTESTSTLANRKRDSGSSESELEVDWQALDRTEEQEKEDRDVPEGTEDESTAFLLARLEQENAKFTADPKSAPTATVNQDFARVRSKSRPLSMAQLKKLVSQQDTPSIRYSLAQDEEQELPDDPPPMTELEFWAALVQDYTSTATRLPTLTTIKIRAGIPLYLRGVVWTSMSGAREKGLEESFERLKHESSPYEGIINKDVGRSFPGVELFRDAEGEGQKMLGRVLKCYSLHDKDIGYCQGLGFLVGPLLMNMGEREAFCVLVRLMEHYALRPSFLPSLSGLHMRIFQFSVLLKQHLPDLAEHLARLGVEPAYLSQWFLSCFAVTCPLPMLFRIYDVIFAEGANETVMRVALALFRRNEQKMMDSDEFEDVMQLLLGRAIWDVYGCNADEMVDDFTSLGNVITHQRLAELERDFETKGGEAVGQSAGFLPDVQAAASRFLGRLWTPAHNHTPSKSVADTLSPNSAEKDAQTPGGSFLTRPGGFLRRTQSKTSIGTINESSGSEGSASSGSASLASTAATDSEIHDAQSRESRADSASMRSKADSMRTVSVSTTHLLGGTGIKENQELHTQIEDLLMALSEMQREHAQMAAMLQKEREDRNDDHRAVRKLVGKIRPCHPERQHSKSVRRSMPPPSRSSAPDETTVADKRRTLPARPREEVRETPHPLQTKVSQDTKQKHSEDDGVEELVQEVEWRLNSNARFSASFETRAQLRSTLARTREQLTVAESQVKSLSERAEFAETSLATFQGENESLRSEVEELRDRVNDDFREKQKLELQVQNMEIQMRMEAKAVEKKQRTSRLARAESSGDVPTAKDFDTPSRSRSGSIASAPGSTGGLRELKLARRDSVGSVQSIRSMKSQRQNSEHLPATSPMLDASPSPLAGEVDATPAVAIPPVVAPPPSAPTPTPAVPPVSPAIPPPAPSSSLSVPGAAAGFPRRTASLATQAVLANPKHEPVPDEALLLELVNAKTAEAQARQEVDELKRSLQMQRLRADEALLEIQAEVASAKMEVEAAKEEAEMAREEAMAARAEVFDASPLATPMMPDLVTPAIEEQPRDEAITPPPAKSGTKKSGSVGGGWFWGRRTASTTKATMEKPSVEM
ncbi:hypothetical protein LTR37_002821 [Vermiconidia calcicola]|uniref:Uncharacterized protein n=1 Tax=Vermiconidia calcicola TaxID=1690605 RepID=A0ACC3NSV6_9PEZI|nr:hypothetical protein LTR37_002821 [Vermiconidia calcicola]